MLNIVLFGAPGCGKGTQAQKIKERYNLNHVSTGAVIRAEIAKGTELGRSVEAYINNGQLAPDGIVIGVISHYLDSHNKDNGSIYDGFPRTVPQAEAFDGILAQHKMKIDVVVSMDVPEPLLIERILLRGKDSGRADDSSESVIRDRIDVYNERTAAVADYYRRQGKYVAIDGVGTPDKVFDRICAVIDALK